MTLTRDFNEKTGQAHVDLKPSNICTSDTGKELFLIDFGYATSPLVKLPGQTGTPLFMSWTLQTIGATCIRN
jgi:serine/threonine protein kinase